jgi:hypothetical protein
VTAYPPQEYQTLALVVPTGGPTGHRSVSPPSGKPKGQRDRKGYRCYAVVVVVVVVVVVGRVGLEPTTGGL